jgi:hypothetical protein
MKARETQFRRSVQRIVRCAFTESEAGHILSLIAGNERNGEHTAPREQYWKRSERIKSKLLKCNVRYTPNVPDQRPGELPKTL